MRRFGSTLQPQGAQGRRVESRDDKEPTRVSGRVAIVLLLWGWLVPIAAAVAAGAPSAATSTTSLVALMQLLEQSGGVRADFVEERSISILAEPIETRGTLYFAPPDRIARVTTHPGRSTAVIRGTHADVIDETGQRAFDLRTSDVAYTLISNIMVLLRGDLPALRERYEIRFEAEGPAWQLDLVPRGDGLKAIVSLVRVKGIGSTVSEMDTLETNGDATRATFSNVETGLDFDAGANGDVFAIDPPPHDE